jgi:hypothetical protein
VNGKMNKRKHDLTGRNAAIGLAVLCSAAISGPAAAQSAEPAKSEEFMSIESVLIAAALEDAVANMDTRAALFGPPEAQVPIAEGAWLLVPAEYTARGASACAETERQPVTATEAVAAELFASNRINASNDDAGICTVQTLDVTTASGLGESWSDGAIEIAFSPEVGACPDGACTLRRFKGEVRLRQSDPVDGTPSGWYLFAGADNKMVVWDGARPAMSNLDDIELHDRVTMGDIEAGISLNRGRADVSIAYVHRQSKYRSWDQDVTDNMDFVGVSLTMD